MANSVVHFEVMGADGKALRGFYSELFGWSFTPMEGMDYGVTAPEEGDPGIGGGVGTSPVGTPMVTFYVAVDDPQAYLERAEAMGGTIVMPLTTTPGGIAFGLLSDPEGNVVGVAGDA